MSADWSLSGGKRTSRGQPNSVENDPSATLRFDEWSALLDVPTSLRTDHSNRSYVVKNSTFPIVVAIDSARPSILNV
jgi:hypothetical protein